MKDAATYASLKKLVEQGRISLVTFMPWQLDYMGLISYLPDSECNILDDDLFNRRLDPPTFTPSLCLGPVPTGLGSFGDSLFDKPAPMVYSNMNELNSLRKVCSTSVNWCVRHSERPEFWQRIELTRKAREKSDAEVNALKQALREKKRQSREG